jgi:hypothetical protein
VNRCLVTAAWRNMQRLKLDFHAFVDRDKTARPSGAVAVGGEGPPCDRLSGSHNEPALTRELPPVEVAKALDLDKADIFEQASELGRGIDAEPERDGAARSVARGHYVLGFNLTGLAESGSG